MYISSICCSLISNCDGFLSPPTDEPPPDEPPIADNCPIIGITALATIATAGIFAGNGKAHACAIAVQDETIPKVACKVVNAIAPSLPFSKAEAIAPAKFAYPAISAS